MQELPPIVDLRQSATALRVQRGVMRLLRESHDMACYAEVTLRSGRRADVLAVGPKGEIWIVEIKSSLIDFQIDRKWPEYRNYSDKFFFAKPPELDASIFPDSEGLIVADGHDGAILRDSPLTPLAPARRKALMLKLARLGADRIHILMDPGPK
ncbi:MmcB family DNA repair protein [Devosia beringensis]|uniref:MmcB family DNA repair protein n=1 Tax=Devosia beringensis TaxID=2657486 RepID=UPI00186B8975|nr:MmcB family DNA repair protein [Devosia beringensis]